MGRKGKNLERREFLQHSAALLVTAMGGAVAGRAAAGDSIEEAVGKVGVLPRRKLGYSGREVSVLIGFGGLAPSLTDAAVRCGINYLAYVQPMGRSGGA